MFDYNYSFFIGSELSVERELDANEAIDVALGMYSDEISEYSEYAEYSGCRV